MARSSAAPDCAALVLGLDSHGLAVARAVADAGVDTFAIDRDPSQPGAATNCVREVFPVHSYLAEHLLPALAKVRQRLVDYRKVVLLAINDRQVEVIGRNLKAIEPLFAVAWAHCAEDVLRLQRKEALQAASESHGLNYPRSVLFDSSVAADAANDFRFPVILKPARPLSSFKTLLAQNPAQLAALLASHQADLPILAQEYIAGDDRQIYFGALMLDHGRVVHAMAGRKIESFPRARGQTTIAETVESPEVLALTEMFFAGLGMSGPVSLELKRGPDGSWWVIEPTVGRTDFWAPLCIGAGFNQPLMEVQIACGLPPSQPQSLSHRVWYDTDRDPLAFWRHCWLQKTFRPFSRKSVFSYWRSGDMRPVWRAATLLVSDTLKRRRATSGAAPGAPGGHPVKPS